MDFVVQIVHQIILTTHHVVIIIIIIVMIIMLTLSYSIVSHTKLLLCYHWSTLTQYTSLGPLHTQAKSRDHVIVRAQKKVSKGHPNTPSKSCSVVTDPQV